MTPDVAPVRAGLDAAAVRGQRRRRGQRRSCAKEDPFVALLRFGRSATIHEHPGRNDTTVVCLAGEGFTSVAGEATAIRAGERARWPRGVPHRLWTEGSAMVTLTIERPREPAAARL